MDERPQPPQTPAPPIHPTDRWGRTTADNSSCDRSAVLNLAVPKKDLTRLPREKSDPVSNDSQPSLKDKRSTRSRRLKTLRVISRIEPAFCAASRTRRCNSQRKLRLRINSSVTSFSPISTAPCASNRHVGARAMAL